MKWTILLSVTTLIGTSVLIAQRSELANFPGDGSAGTSLGVKRPASERPTIFANGIIEGAHRTVPLHFEIDGTLESVNVQEGDHVHQGDVLAQLNANIWRQKLEEEEARLALATSERERLMNAARRETLDVARAEVAVAEVKVDQAQNEWKRGELLYSQKVVSREEWENRRHSYAMAMAELQLAEARATETAAPARDDELQIADAKIALARAAAEQARTMLGKTSIVAPRDGVILKVNGEPGQLIHADAPVPLISMTDARRLRVRGYVEELDALAVSAGQRAWVLADGMPGVRFAGTVVMCAPSMIDKELSNNRPGERVDVKVREVVIELDQADPLVVGLPVDIYIEPNSAGRPAAERQRAEATNSGL